MGVNVTTRTVWFAVCQHCTRSSIGRGEPYWSTAVHMFDSEAERNAWEVGHNRGNAATHLSPDTVVWCVTASVPDA